MASRVKVLLASSPQLQYISTARGTHTQPHFGSSAVCFLVSAASAAAPTLILASAKTGDVTVMSKVAGLPCAQSITSTSAGRVRSSPGVRATSSF